MMAQFALMRRQPRHYAIARARAGVGVIRLAYRRRRENITLGRTAWGMQTGARFDTAVSFETTQQSSEAKLVADTEISKPFDPFELAAAILLGLGAVASAVAGYQAGLWGGASVEGYGESAAMTTEASSTYNDELTSYIQDAQIDVRAKEMVWEASEIDDEARAARLMSMASWLYTSQLSEHAYAGLKLPQPTEDEHGEVQELPKEALEEALNIDLDEDYVDALFAPSSTEFDAAKARFTKAREANEMGDKFALAAVILTISLFFGGLALVFKTRVRWGFLGSGAVILVVGTGYMVTLTWA